MRAWKRSSPRPVGFVAFGVPIELALGETGYEAELEELLPPGSTRCDVGASAGRFGLRRTGADSYEVSVGDEPWMEHATRDVALRMLDAQIRLYVAAHSRDWIFVHAGVVARDGKALVIPGESFSGKTTLVVALVELGASYYSDEYAVLDSQGRVHPYPRPLSIRGENGAATRERPVDQLGGVAAQASAELVAVAVTRYRPGTRWQPRRLSAGEGVLALLANTVPAQTRPRESLRALSRAVAGAMVLEGDRGEAGPTAASLLRELTALTSAGGA
jgi:hypothetical protein